MSDAAVEKTDDELIAEAAEWDVVLQDAIDGFGDLKPYPQNTPVDVLKKDLSYLGKMRAAVLRVYGTGASARAFAASMEVRPTLRTQGARLHLSAAKMMEAALTHWMQVESLYRETKARLDIPYTPLFDNSDPDPATLSELAEWQETVAKINAKMATFQQALASLEADTSQVPTHLDDLNVMTKTLHKVMYSLLGPRTQAIAAEDQSNRGIALAATQLSIACMEATAAVHDATERANALMWSAELEAS